MFKPHHDSTGTPRVFHFMFLQYFFGLELQYTTSYLHMLGLTTRVLPVYFVSFIHAAKVSMYMFYIILREREREFGVFCAWWSLPD
jgi:hypothetical protein